MHVSYMGYTSGFTVTLTIGLEKSELTAFLVALWALSGQSALGKAVDLVILFL